MAFLKNKFKSKTTASNFGNNYSESLVVKNQETTHANKLLDNESHQQNENKALLNFYHYQTLTLLKKAKLSPENFTKILGINVIFHHKLLRYEFQPLNSVLEYQAAIRKILSNPYVIFCDYQSSMIYSIFHDSDSYQRAVNELETKKQKMPIIMADLEKISPEYFNWNFINSVIDEAILLKKSKFNNVLVFSLVNWVQRQDNFGKKEHFLLKQFQYDNNISQEFNSLDDVYYAWDLYIQQWKVVLANNIEWYSEYEAIFSKLNKVAKLILNFRQKVFVENFKKAEKKWDLN